MKTHNFLQGSDGWLALRRYYHTASEAPAACGKSKYMSRAELLRQKNTGIVESVDGYKQALFDRGHAAEASARAIAEIIIGAELYPITCTETVDGLDLLASLDGCTLDETIIWEHKLFAEGLAADVRAGTLDPHYTIQLDQQMLVTGAKKCLFMTSDGTEENMAWCWYKPSHEKFDALVAGWKQFRIDLAAYVPAEVIPAAVATPTIGLPALSIQVNGAISLISNLDLFGVKLKEFVANVPAKPSTDQEFADAEAAIKTLGKAEDALNAAESAALAQTASIDDMRRVKAMYFDLARNTRLMLEKLVKARKEAIRYEIQQESAHAFLNHIDVLNARIGRGYLTIPNPDFAGAMKGLKTVCSLRNACDTLLAHAKIEADAAGDRISANIATLRAMSVGREFLFADEFVIVHKQPDDLVALIKSRIADHVAAEAMRIEAARARIAEEERIKAEAKVREEQIADQRRVDELHAHEEAEALARENEAIAEAQRQHESAMSMVDVENEFPMPNLAKHLGIGKLTGIVPSKPSRPTDNEMIKVLADHYAVSTSIVRTWLRSANLNESIEKALAEQA